MNLAKPAGRLRSVWLVLALIPAMLLLRWAFIEQLDSLAFDFALRLRGAQPPDARIVIVAIDDGSLQQVGPWPWSATLQETLFSNILAAKPALLGVDVLLPSLGDHPSLRSANKVVVATALGSNQSHFPSLLFWEVTAEPGTQGGPALGHIHADKDLDGVCRSIPFAVSQSGVRRWAFSIELARLFWGVAEAGMRVQDDGLLIGEHRIPRLDSPIDNSLDSPAALPSLRGDHFLLNSRGGPQTFPYVSASDVISASAPALQVLRNRIVLVGSTSYALGDHLATAFSGATEMPGIEIHANALDTILNHRFLKTTTELETILLIIVAITLTWALLVRFRAWGLTILVSTLAGAVVSSLLLLFRFSLWIPMASLVIAVASTGGATQFLRFSTLNRQLNRRFQDLSHLLRRQAAVPSELADDGESFRSKSLEWKLKVLGDAADSAFRLTQAREERVSFVAHELKAPLASIVGFSELLQKPGLLTESERQEALGLMHQEAERLAAIAGDYLGLAKLEQSGLDLQFREIDLPAVVDSACRSVGPQLRERRIQLHVSGAESPPARVAGNEAILTQVFVNLLSNAIRYSPADRSITVTWEVGANSVIVSIRDRGFGITAEDLPLIFNKFYRGTLPEGETPAGSGLGLAFVKHAVQLHRGSVRASSCPGEGSTFCVTLPRIVVSE